MAARLILLCIMMAAGSMAGFVSPGTSVYLGSSPTLQYLLQCGYLPRKPATLSTYDIYTLASLSQGIRRLQAAMGVAETGKEGAREREVVRQGQCLLSDAQPSGETQFPPAVSPSVPLPSHSSHPAPYTEFPSSPSPVSNLQEKKRPPTVLQKKPFTPGKKHFPTGKKPSNLEKKHFSSQKKSSQLQKKPPAPSGGTGSCSPGLLPYSSCSPSFLSCWAGQASLLHCPAGTVFSPSIQQCTWPSMEPTCH